VIEQSENKLDIGALVKKVLGLILPMFVVGIITSFFMWGSFFFFFFPALFIAYFLMFTQYEVLFEGKRGFAALKSSFQMVSQHFGEIFIRCLAYFFFYLIILVVFPAIVSKIDKNLGTIVSFFMIIVQWLGNLYGVVFSITLYKQIKAATDVNKKTSMTWLFVVTILGWIIFGIIAYAGIRAGMNQLKGGAWKQYLSTLEKTKQPEQTAKVFSHIPSNCGLSIPLPDTNDTLTKKTRHWIYEERTLAVDSFRNLAPEITASEDVLGTFFGYKSDDLRFKPEDKSFRSTTGIDTVCVNNVKNWNLNQFIDAAQKNKKYTVVKNLGFLTWGDVKVYSIFVEGITQGGDYFKEPLNIGVTADGKRLFYIKQWGVTETDPNAKQITSDIYTILNGLKYRAVDTDIKSSTQKPVVPSCQRYTIREGEFASNKCYSSKDYSDLIYYLGRFNDAAFSFNGAQSSMQITCNGSEFFKNSCESDKQQKSKAETDINNYRGIINGIIARGN
jgi:hypothetical protein